MKKLHFDVGFKAYFPVLIQYDKIQVLSTNFAKTVFWAPSSKWWELSKPLGWKPLGQSPLVSHLMT